MDLRVVFREGPRRAYWHEMLLSDYLSPQQAFRRAIDGWAHEERSKNTESIECWLLTRGPRRKIVQKERIFTISDSAELAALRTKNRWHLHAQFVASVAPRASCALPQPEPSGEVADGMVNSGCGSCSRDSGGTG
jgi:hypothetical protein